MQKDLERRIGEGLFARVRAAFPMLSMQVAPDHPDYAIQMSIPAQPGLLFAVDLRLRDDELEIHAGAIDLGYVGVSEPTIREHCFEGVSGLLSGEFRIRETRAWGRTVQSELQRPTPDGWQTILMTCEWREIPRRTTKRILQNRP